MLNPMCLRCLRLSLKSPSASTPSLTTTRVTAALFSTSAPLSANPPKKKATPNVGVRTGSKQGSTLRLAKNKRVVTSRRPAPGERKALRKRVILTNPNALEVEGLEDLTAFRVKSKERLGRLHGVVVGFEGETVKMLGAAEAFKPLQGWSLFKRPAALVRRETVDLGGMMEDIGNSNDVKRVLLAGERGSGKSVLQLQAMAMANLLGWVVIHIPEARDLAIGHTAYVPVKTAGSGGRTLYMQPQATAHLLGNIAQANQTVLSNLSLSKQHQLPVPLQPNLSLARLAEMGANDAQLAWPIWQALWSELAAPSQPNNKSKSRPPILFTADGIDHIMRDSAYLNSEAKPIHAHDLALVNDFVGLLSGKTALPNGGMVLAAISRSTPANAPALYHLISRKHAERQIQPVLATRNDLRGQAESATEIDEIDLTALEHMSPLPLPEPLRAQFTSFQRRCLRLQTETSEDSSETALQSLRKLLAHFDPKLPEWNPYVPFDTRVEAALDGVEVMMVDGLTKEETRSVMEYYAKSGMLRATVTDGLVSEQWTLAGHGLVGELERGTVRSRF